jgi:ATP-dependent Clp protease ATP-binding subunit ClpA
MFERFTKPARRVVEQSFRHAELATAAEVRPEHLLGAMLDEEESLAVRVLDQLGAPVESLRAELTRLRTAYVDGLDAEDAEALRAIGIDLDEVVRRIDRNLGGGTTRPSRPKLARSSKKVLQLALREAIALRHNYIGTEHLLLGMVREGDRVVADTLAAFDIEPGVLRRALADAVRKAG